MQGFRQAFEDNNLIQIPTVGSFFIWEKDRESNNLVREKFNRALAIEDWARKFTNAVCSVVHVPRSDHKPLVINTSPKDNKGDRRRFRFDNAWLCDEGVAEVVKGVWVNSIPHNLLMKCDNLVSALSLWGRSRNREFSKKKKIIQRLLDNRPSTIPHASLKEDWNRLLEQEEARLKQQANGSVDCEWVFELVSPLISDADNADICAPFLNEEFRAALFQMHPDKAPGPDGLNHAFYQRFWHLIGNDVSDGCRLWLQQCTFPYSLTEKLIVLIIKVDSPKTVKDCRPIALCNVLYKIVAIALANKFKRVLLMIISENQSAFILHRLITDNVMVAFEMIHNMKINKSRNDDNYALRIDISKAYDMVELEFLKGMLERFDFSAQWIKWLTMCFSEVSYNINFNGNWIGPIVPSRGLRQGDPISPYIYLVCAEGLSLLLKDVESSGWLLEEVDSIKSILNTYAAASGQVVNFNKSGIFFSPNVVSSVRSNISSILDVHSLLSHSTYLGLPSLIRRNKKEDTFFADDGSYFIEPHLRVCDLFEDFEVPRQGSKNLCNGLCTEIMLLYQVDGALFQSQDFIGYGFVVENSEDIFQRSVFGFSEGNGTPIIVEVLALCHCLLFAI
ncbi:uncharacterized protein LOC110620962 [Manihot esculenta]|uniref:uncharacterized protein LOC110620962 n=1 Tax=Manihot esculenta TaxID=3983 RepID=UPI000B5D563D|nr:uncharacterized protein LOC110620962 [Manihot esculenta]